MKVFHKVSIKFLHVFVFVAVSFNGYGQLFKGEVLIGGNLNQVDGDRVVGYKKAGFCGGLGLVFPFRFSPKYETKSWSASMEIFFSQRGARETNPNYNAKDTINSASRYEFKYRLQLNYVCLPFMLHYTDKERYSVGLGLSYNRLVSSKEIEFDIPQTYDTVAHFNSSDFMFVCDLRCRIWQQLKVGFRFEYSITPIRSRFFYASGYNKPDETRRQYNNTLSLYLVYVFNEKKSDLEAEKYKKKNIYYY